jgi:hypothetical protein
MAWSHVETTKVVVALLATTFNILERRYIWACNIKHNGQNMFLASPPLNSLMSVVALKSATNSVWMKNSRCQPAPIPILMHLRHQGPSHNKGLLTRFSASFSAGKHPFNLVNQKDCVKW